MSTATLSPTNPATALPKGWKWMTLGEVAQTTSGGTPTTGVEEYYNGTIPWVKSGDLNNGYLNSCQDSITELGLANSSAKLFKPGTLLLALYGATIGRISILNFEAATNQAVCGISPSKNLDVKFLFYYLLCIRQKLIDQGQGGAQPNINQRIARETPIPVPPLSVQRAIAARLDAQLSLLDATASKLKTLQSKLKRYRQALLKSAVTGELTRRWREVKGPAAEAAPALLERILRDRRKAFCGRGKYTEPQAPDTAGLPELPEGWCWASVGQVCTVDVGFAFKSAEFETSGIKLLRGENLEPGALRWKDTKYWPESKLCGLEKLFLSVGDIILAMDRPVISSGFKIARVKTIDLPCLLVQRMARIHPLIKAMNSLIYYIMNSESFINHIFAGQTGTQIPHVSGSNILTFKFPLPPLAEQQQIVVELEHRFTLLDRLESQINHNLKRTDALKQAALKKALRINHGVLQ